MLEFEFQHGMWNARCSLGLIVCCILSIGNVRSYCKMKKITWHTINQDIAFKYAYLLNISFDA